ncbi:MAG TPA: PadR family transcriptional regulator [Spirochaetia bacterium]|nr:MAG: hypothetical protein A2Y41_08260 [Spirochaetes bacterium GWB1_36_13]HCL55507.1 PadR family transcriptional regulator [Spirochaetia bacterium]
MAKENYTRYLILGLLSHESLSGYDIKKRMESSIRYFWEISFGQIYPELANLEKEGFIVKKIEINPESQNRKIYTITQKGIEILKQWLFEPAGEEKLKYPILVKLFFAHEIPVQNSIDQLQDFSKRNETNLNMMGHYEKQLKSALLENDDHTYFLLTVLLGKKIYQAQIDWAEESIQILNDLKMKREEK